MEFASCASLACKAFEAGVSCDFGDSQVLCQYSCEVVRATSARDIAFNVEYVGCDGCRNAHSIAAYCLDFEQPGHLAYLLSAAYSGCFDSESALLIDSAHALALTVRLRVFSRDVQLPVCAALAVARLLASLQLPAVSFDASRGWFAFSESARIAPRPRFFVLASAPRAGELAVYRFGADFASSQKLFYSTCATPESLAQDDSAELRALAEKGGITSLCSHADA